MKIQPVILAGGGGSRLWPISRQSRPKPFNLINSDTTMLANTLTRLKEIDCLHPIIVTNESHKFFVKEISDSLNVKPRIIIEPFGKNTAPAIAAAALIANKNCNLLVMPSDHLIESQEDFLNIVNNASNAASLNKLVVFGVKPDSPHTGYGYIHTENVTNDKYLTVKSFFEKPNLEMAQKYIKDKNFFWNSGMFMFSNEIYLEELKLFNLDIFNSVKKSIPKFSNEDVEIELISKEFELCPSDSIDYAVMEKTNNAICFPLTSGWNDLGSWKSIYDSVKPDNKDKNCNVSIGDNVLVNSFNNIIISKNRLVAAVGISDLAIIETSDAILVTTKDNSEDVKKLVDHLKNEERNEYEWHREVHRPWGKYDSIDQDKGFQVKRITVNPGAKLSVQMHHHRSEHWVVVSGIGRVHYGDEYRDLNINESTYHDKEVIHALENPGNAPLILIEVQIGDYLGEDDIIRYDDIYGRS